MLAVTLVVTTRTGLKRLASLEIQRDAGDFGPVCNYTVTLREGDEPYTVLAQGRVENHASREGALKLLRLALDAIAVEALPGL